MKGLPMSEAVHTLDDVVRLLAEHEEEAARTLNLVPSENVMTGLAKLPMLLDPYHRYFFNESDDPGRWHFRGAQRLRALETEVTVPLLERLGRAHRTSTPTQSAIVMSRQATSACKRPAPQRWSASKSSTSNDVSRAPKTSGKPNSKFA
jgi:hypothetical protein